MDLSNLKPPAGATHPKKRVGRGQGSGNGKTAGRGHKGAQSRSGYKSKRGFEGGQMPLHRRVPKRGFHNPFRVDYAVVNLDAIAKTFEADTVVTPELLREHGMVSGARSKIKVLARGDIAKKLTIRAHRFSGKAAEKIVAAGGAAETLGQDGLASSDNGPRTDGPRASGTGPRTGGPRASGTGPGKETV